MIENILKFITSISWPLVVIIALFYLGKDLKKIIPRLKEAKLPGNTGLVFSLPKDQNTKTIETQDIQFDEKLDKAGNIFWLAADLSYAWEALTIGENRERILHCINQTLHHINELDFLDKKYQKMVKKIKGQIDETLESELTQEFRTLMANDLFSIRMELGWYIAARQKDFKGYPNK